MCGLWLGHIYTMLSAFTLLDKTLATTDANYNQSMNRKKEASPVITTGNHSSRTIKEDEELFRNGVGGPFV